MIGRVRESRNPKKVIRVSLRESYGEIRRVPVNLSLIQNTRGHLGQERKHCGDNIHQVIVREKYEPDCIIYRRDL